MLERLTLLRGHARNRTIRRFCRSLASAALLPAIWLTPAPASASPATTVPTAAPGPALWVVRDADTTVFLFGTFHALDQNSAWFGPSIKAAFNASDELVLETLVPEDPIELHAALARQAGLPEPQAGQPVYGSQSAPSFVASAGQAMSAGRQMGMSVDNGADFVLRRAAEAEGKPVEGLESFDFQLRMFGSLPPQGPAPRQSAVSVGNFIGNMESAWKRGDNSAFANVLGTMRSQSPMTYKTLFVDRNANWASWIADRMQKPGVVFLAVGTGHLIGPDSVQQQLAARGITSARIS